MESKITIHPVLSRRDLSRFIKFPWRIYRADPAWVPPLIVERRQILNRRKNPFFEHAEAEYFLAERDGEAVGRITAHIDRLHNETHGEKTGFFGFFESVEESAVSGALLDRARSWLEARGMRAMRGPCSFTMNEEAGLLVEGHGHPPFLMMGHNPAYYPGLLESWGLAKVKDLYCWRYDSSRPIPEAAARIADEVRKYPGLVIREVTPKTLDRDVKILIAVFNSAFEKNWGFVPMTGEEVRKAARDFRLILEPRLALIAEVDGVPAAISLALPNLNEAISDLNGRLFPFGIFKLLYRIRAKKIRSARLMLLGVEKQFRGGTLGGLSVLLYAEKHRRSRELGHWGGELSWTLEDNVKINTGIEMMGGERYKTCRIYEKAF